MSEIERQRASRDAKTHVIHAPAHRDSGLLRYLAAQGYAIERIEEAEATKPEPEQQPDKDEPG